MVVMGALLLHSPSWARQRDWAQVPGKEYEKDGLPFDVWVSIRTPQPPRLDGRLDEACWRAAVPISDFKAVLSAEAVSEQTVVRVLHDDKALYIGIRAEEHDMDKLKTEHDEGGCVFLDDCVELVLRPEDCAYLAPFYRTDQFYHLLTNTEGKKLSAVGAALTAGFWKDWSVAVHKDKDYYSMEIKLPFESLRSTVSPGGVWWFHVCRADYTSEKTVWSSCAPLRRNFHDMAYTGRLAFLDSKPEVDKDGVLDVKLRSHVLRRTHLDPLLGQGGAEGRKLLEELGTYGAARILKERKALDRKGKIFRRNARHARMMALVKEAESKKQPFLVLVSDPSDLYQPIGNRLPPSAKPGRRLRIAACPGEYEPATFSITSSKQLRSVLVTPGDLKGPKGTIPASALDVRVVKCWYQSHPDGCGYDKEDKTGAYYMPELERARAWYMPELLLKDPSMVIVDHASRRNFLRNEKAPRDAKTLQPVDVPPYIVQQFWITALAPDDAKAGTYEGELTISADGMPDCAVRVSLTVYPFRLEPSVVEHSIFCRAQIMPDRAKVVNSDCKTEQQYEAEMLDLLRHGVTNPTIMQSIRPGKDGTLDLSGFERALEIREKVGIRPKVLFSCGSSRMSNVYYQERKGSKPPGYVTEEFKRDVTEILALVRKRGYETAHFYGRDEASGESLGAEKTAFETVRKLGGKSFAAGYVGYHKQVGDLMDVLIMSGIRLPAEARRAHKMGNRIFNYAFPTLGVESFLVMRRNYGLALWRCGYDGACSWTYQQGFGFPDRQRGLARNMIWDDFDTIKHGRDAAIAYPTADGVVPTIQWEGYREGVDDTRYLGTLLKAMENAKKHPRKAARIKEIQEWLDAVAIPGNPQPLREQMVNFILELPGLRQPTPHREKNP